MGQRAELHTLLKTLLDSDYVYFMPPPSVKMSFPCIVYRRADVHIDYADNAPYKNKKRYQITVIDANPDSEIPDKVSALPLCSFDRFSLPIISITTFITFSFKRRTTDVSTHMDGSGERLYETGVDKGVLFIPDEGGAYSDGVAWNGLTAVTEKPSGADPNPQFADNIKYLNLFSAEQFAATLEAFTYPDEFAQFDGLSAPSPGVLVGQQNRGSFGLCYRTKKGNDVDGDDHGYKLHMIYGCKASPSEKAYATINDSPAAIVFSWEISTTPALVTDLKPTSIITIDSTVVDADALAALEGFLYGTELADPSLPDPDAVIALFDGSITVVSSITAPTYNSSTDLVTIPTVTGVEFFLNDIAVAAGTHAITENAVVTARPADGYVFSPDVDDDWHFTFV